MGISFWYGFGRLMGLPFHNPLGDGRRRVRRMTLPANDLKIYDRHAENWWKVDTGLSGLKLLNPPRFVYFDNFVPDWTGIEVLDIGCGGGFSSEFLAKRGARVSGIDQSSKSIDVAKKHAGKNGLNIAYRHGKAEQLPYGENHFDVVVCVDVLEHVSDLGKVVSEAHRVLKMGGLFLFDSINKTFKAKFLMIWLLEYLARRLPKGTHDWNMFIPPDILVGILTDNRFQKIEIKGFDIKAKNPKTGALKVAINDNTAVFYIGKCIKG